jgi:hypothetical protein
MLGRKPDLSPLTSSCVSVFHVNPFVYTDFMEAPDGGAIADGNRRVVKTNWSMEFPTECQKVWDLVDKYTTDYPTDVLVTMGKPEKDRLRMELVQAFDYDLPHKWITWESSAENARDKHTAAEVFVKRTVSKRLLYAQKKVSLQ